MAAFVKYNVFSEDLAKKVHDLNADTLKICLSNTAPNVSTHAVRGDVTEIAGGAGYTSGGIDVQNTTSRSGAVTSILFNSVDPVWTSSGAFAQFRYVILYNDTPASPLDPLIGYWDYGSAVDLTSGQTFTVDFTGSIFTVGG